jgi:hypothetical protein
MAAQRITVAKVAGRSGAVVVAHFRAWSDARTTRDPNTFSAGRWPAACRREMDAFAAALRADAHRPPVVFFSEHMDLWSMGDLFAACAGPAAGGLVEVCSDRLQVACYRLPDGGVLAGSLERSFRRKRIRERNPQEERWFRLLLLEAVRAWEGLVGEAALVVLREVLGPTMTDEELKNSFAAVPDWVPAVNATE